VGGADRALDRAFGEVLRERRGRTGLSQEALAHMAGLHRNYVGQLERGQKSPSLGVIAVLARALQTRPHLLIQAAERRLGT
jgi:transcriptional regulator with XRE-family HTH domain